MNTLFKSLLALALMSSSFAFAEMSKTSIEPEGHPMSQPHGDWANKSVSREQVMQHAGKRFERMDTNHDGMMSPEERRAGIEQMREKMHERMAQRKQNGM